MSEKVNDRLDSWKAIAEYLDRDPTTVMRWARERGLPVYAVPGEGQRHRAVYAYKGEIDAWLKKPAPLGLRVNERKSQSEIPRSARNDTRRLGELAERGSAVRQNDQHNRLERPEEGHAEGPNGRAAPQAPRGSAVVPDALASSPSSRPGTGQSLGIPDSTFQIPDSTSQIPDSKTSPLSRPGAGQGLGIADSTFQIPDSKTSPLSRSGAGQGLRIPDSTSQIPDSKTSPSSRPGGGQSLGIPDSTFPIPDSKTSPPFRLGARLSVWIVFLGSAFLIALAAAAWLRVPPPEPKVLGFEQLTNDGFEKRSGPVTDGARLYFTEDSRDGWVVAEIPTSGGSPVAIAKASRDSALEDISPDRAELLLIESTRLKPGPVWILSLLAGSTRRLGSIQAFSAAWSPDGAALAYTTDDGLYLCDANGSNMRRIVAMSGRLEAVHWSPDGRQLCLMRFSSNKTTLWEVDRDGKGLRRLFAGEDTFHGESTGFWTPDGKYLIFHALRSGHTEPWVLRPSAGLFRRNNQATCLGLAGIEFGAAAISPDRSRLYGFGVTRTRYQIERFDSPSKQFVPYLPDVPATAVDFTKDGQWIAYVDDHRRLWKSRNDGGGKVQLTLSPLEVEMPRWSPDGKWVAFIGQDPGQPWKVRVVSAEGGPYGPVTSTDAAEGAPTWSPDGSRLAFGGLVNPGARTPGPLVIHLFDLKERRLSVVPGSEGLWTARWSPDGRYIAALTQDSRSLMLFDFRARKWTKLFTVGQIRDLSWSRQGKSIYLIVAPPGGELALFRLKIPGHQPERLTGMGSAGLYEPLGLAPDDSPLLTRSLTGGEVYALQCQFP